MANHQLHSAANSQQQHPVPQSGHCSQQTQRSPKSSSNNNNTSNNNTSNSNNQVSSNHGNITQVPSQQTPKPSRRRSTESKQQPWDGDQWVCVLCRKICHYKGLGDLYGPYNIDFSASNSCPDSNIEKQSKPITPKKSRYSLLNHNYAVKEIWIHEDCLVWSEGVHLIGKKILKMEDTIKASFNHNCSICKVKGATIGCAGKRCRRKFHYVCGREANCLLDEANFTLKCDKCVANTAANLSLLMNR